MEYHSEIVICSMLYAIQVHDDEVTMTMLASVGSIVIREVLSYSYVSQASRVSHMHICTYGYRYANAGKVNLSTFLHSSRRPQVYVPWMANTKKDFIAIILPIF